MFIESFYTFLGEVVVFLAILVIILFIAILILGFLIAKKIKSSFLDSYYLLWIHYTSRLNQ